MTSRRTNTRFSQLRLALLALLLLMVLLLLPGCALAAPVIRNGTHSLNLASASLDAPSGSALDAARAAASTTLLPLASAIPDSLEFRNAAPAHRDFTTPDAKFPKRWDTDTNATSADNDDTSAGSSKAGHVNELATYWGDITMYKQWGNTGACGERHGDWDKVVAISHERNPVQNGYCGKTVGINYGSSTHRFRAVDMCPGCNYNSIDLSEGAFNEVTGKDTGRYQANWWIEW